MEHFRDLADRQVDSDKQLFADDSDNGGEETLLAQRYDMSRVTSTPRAIRLLPWSSTHDQFELEDESSQAKPAATSKRPEFPFLNGSSSFDKSPSSTSLLSATGLSGLPDDPAESDILALEDLLQDVLLLLGGSASDASGSDLLGWMRLLSALLGAGGSWNGGPSEVDGGDGWIGGASGVDGSGSSSGGPSEVDGGDGWIGGASGVDDGGSSIGGPNEVDGSDSWSGGGVRGERAPAMTGGTSDEQAGVFSAHRTALRLMDSAILTLEDAKTTPNALVSKHFGISGTSPEDQAHLDELISGFQAMRANAGSPGYEIDSTDPSDPGVLGYVTPGEGPVHVVDPAFENQSESGQAGVLVHELSHYYAGTDDLAYDWQNTHSSLTPDQERRNADNWSDFAAAAGS